MLITLPSGLSFRARTWELGDQGELLSDAEDDEKVLAISMLRLAAEKDGVVSPGPYPFKEGGDVDWNLVTHGDITVANFMLRIATDPDVYLEAACIKCGSLPKGDGIHVHLPDVEVFPPSTEGLDSISTGTPVPLELEDKEGNAVTVHLRPILGKHLALMTRAIKDDESKIIEIQTCMGVEKIVRHGDGEIIKGLVAVRKFHNVQHWSLGRKIEEYGDDLYGGVDAVVNFRCGKLGCGREQEAPIPLDPRFYGLSPKKKRKGGLKLSAVSRSIKKTTHEVSLISSSDTPMPPTSTSVDSSKRKRPRSG